MVRTQMWRLYLRVPSAGEVNHHLLHQMHVSPNANSGASSPSHLSARPSSGGGTRPSSSGSDKAPELTTNAWRINSRPSSSSGALASSQTLQTSLRPHNAETRPGSSQLSRLADHVTENSVAWNAARTTEILENNEGLGLDGMNDEEFEDMC